MKQNEGGKCSALGRSLSEQMSQAMAIALTCLILRKNQLSDDGHFSRDALTILQRCFILLACNQFLSFFLPLSPSYPPSFPPSLLPSFPPSLPPSFLPSFLPSLLLLFIFFYLYINILRTRFHALWHSSAIVGWNNCPRISREIFLNLAAAVFDFLDSFHIRFPSGFYYWFLFLLLIPG